MEFLPIVGLFAAFLVAATYALKADWVRDQILNWTAKAYGADGLTFRVQKWFVNNALYVTSFRIVAGVVAVCLLVAIVVLLRSSPRNW
jgi:hypothetical protein